MLEILSIQKYQTSSTWSMKKLLAWHLNCRFLVNKDLLVGQMLRDVNIDFALLTETWFSNDKQHQFKTCDLNQNGYKISVVNRQHKIGGGLAVTCRSNVKMHKISSGIKRSFEFGVWQLILKKYYTPCGRHLQTSRLSNPCTVYCGLLFVYGRYCTTAFEVNDHGRLQLAYSKRQQHNIQT